MNYAFGPKAINFFNFFKCILKVLKKSCLLTMIYIG